MRVSLPALLLFLTTSFLWSAAPPTPPDQSRARLYSPPIRPAVPALIDKNWVQTPIDHFVLAKLEAKGLAPAIQADKLTLLRRVTFDLTGLPPTVAEQDAFLADTAPDAYSRVVERLLSSPHHGERMTQHWLDLVRYAETDGFKEDAHRPDAYRYRDWVIRAFNANLPYDRFVAWQLAGDELAPNEPDALVATGFNRLWPDEYNAVNLEQRRQEILDDNTDTVGLVFLGMTFGCARCHDHKYDPISQRDYFRLQSFFAAMQPADLPLADEATRKAYAEKLAKWEATTQQIRSDINKLVAAKVQVARKDAIGRFNADIQAAVYLAPEKRTPLQTQIALTALKQADRAEQGIAAKLDAAGKKKYQELQDKLAAFGPAPSLPRVMAISDVSAKAPPTHRLVGGNWRNPAKEVTPAVPDYLGNATLNTTVPEGLSSTGRRSALARWMTQTNHPLTARVMANRLWQYHFGVGIIATASDFGVQGTQATHPELLDWLAVEFVESGWDMKHMHRLMVLSAAYQQSSIVDAKTAQHEKANKADPDNNLLWHARRRRLEGEAIRDAVLSVTGDLSPRMQGVSAKPALPAAFGKLGWKPDDDELSRNRRSVYVMAKRNLRYPLFDAFDQPDMHNSCSRRLQTTTAPQALLLLNGELTLGHARNWAQALLMRHSDLRGAVASAYRAAWGRLGTSEEVDLGMRFVERQKPTHREGNTPETEVTTAALADFCHALLNTNEFVYVD